MNLSKYQSKNSISDFISFIIKRITIIIKKYSIKLLIIKKITVITSFIEPTKARNSILFLISSIAIFLGITSVNSANSYALTYESQAGVRFTINDTIKLSITGDITIPELFPGNTEESNVINIKVSTNTKNGYSLSAKMGTTNADLTTTSSSSKFTGLPTDASESTLADNTWGYKIKTGDSSWSNYSGLPISADTEKVLIERNTQPTSGEETTQFKIGAHASTSMPANTYSNTIIFHAVANSQPEPPETRTLADIETMQEMTPEICANSAENETKQLKDTRDDKLYWVTKLKDGNCWMTQNLDLGDNGMADMVLTPADSDVATNFTFTAPGTTSFDSSHYDVINYRDPGEQYYISGGFYDDTSYTSKSACEAANSAELCQHSHAGNYYNWYTATAGTGTQSMSTDGQEASSSICPKGWRLPTNSSAPDAKSYYNLLHDHDILIGQSYIGNGSNIIRSNPLYFVRSGIYDDSSLYNASYNGLYWSSTVSSGNYAHDLDFDSDTLYPQSSKDKYSGLSVRCLARNTPINVTIAYDKNTTDAVSNMPANQSLSNFDGETTPPTISSQVPARDGHLFAGWTTSSDGEAKYSPGSLAYFSTSDMSKNITLYAVWLQGGFSFSIDGNTYIAASGSTWGDWLNSSFNDTYCENEWSGYILNAAEDNCRGDWYNYIPGVSVMDIITPGASYFTSAYHSCLLKGTEITLWDDKTKKIEDLTYDDKLLVWNFDEGRYDTASIAWLTESGLHNDHYYKLTFSDGTVLKTTGEKSNHKVFNTDKQYFQGVSSIEIGTHVYTENGIVTLVDKEYIEDDVEYYNVITNTHFNVFANGVLTGNRYDNMYNISGMKYIKDNRTIKPYFEFAANGIDRYWYDTLRLGEQSDSMEEIVDYIHKLESQMRERE